MKKKRKQKKMKKILILLIIISSIVIFFSLFNFNTNNKGEDQSIQNKKEINDNKSTQNNETINKKNENKTTTSEENDDSNNLANLYAASDYTNGVVDPKKIDTEQSLNQNSDLILVNKKYTLNENYIPEVSEVEGKYLRPYVIDSYLKMKNEALTAGVNLNLGSTYRSYYGQVEVFNSYLNQDSYENVITYSAYPGTSEHQTGLVIDFSENGACDYTQCFENTLSGSWLKENAYKYGFILRFPKGKEHITGYMYEPWHYRYVGVDDAKKIHNNNLTLEEYVLK